MIDSLESVLSQAPSILEGGNESIIYIAISIRHKIDAFSIHRKITNIFNQRLVAKVVQAYLLSKVK